MGSQVIYGDFMQNRGDPMQGSIGVVLRYRRCLSNILDFVL